MAARLLQQRDDLHAAGWGICLNRVSAAAQGLCCLMGLAECSMHLCLPCCCQPSPQCCALCSMADCDIPRLLAASSIEYINQGTLG